MPETLVIERRPSAPSELSGAGPRYQRAFTVIASSQSDSYEVLKGATGIVEGVEYTDHQGKTPDVFVKCLRVQSQALTQVPIDGTGLFDVIADYGYEDTQDFQRAIPTDGTRRWWLERNLTTEAVDKDRNNKPITNSADEPIDPPLQRFRVEKVLVIQWYKLFASMQAAQAYCSTYDDKINALPFYTAPQHCLYCMGIDPGENPVRRAFGSMGTYKLTARFAYKPPKTLYGPNHDNEIYGGWVANPFNWGRRVKNPSGVFRKIRLGENGLTLTGSDPQVTDPVALATNGMSYLLDPTQGNYRAIHLYNEIDFNTLGV